MASNTAAGTRLHNRLDPRTANVTYGVATLRRITLHKAGKNDRPDPAFYSKTDVMITTTSNARTARIISPATQARWSATGHSTIAFDPNDGRRTVAEIQRACIAVRRTEPDARARAPMATVEADQRQPAWIVIGGIWMSTILVSGIAVIAMVYLLG